jgi:carbamoyl-phosphate synthase small subunit
VRGATLLLSDGTLVHGHGLGAPGIVSGELVFTTAMTGYEEALTDPSYRGQILMFTYPLIGNYGVEPGRAQSNAVQPRAVIVSTLSDSWAGCESLGAYLLANRVPAVYGVDTRAIAQWVREHGAMPAALGVHGDDPVGTSCVRPDVTPRGCEPSLPDLRAALDACDYDTTDFVFETTVRTPEIYGRGGKALIALLDCGNKRSVIDVLLRRDAEVVALPAHTSAAEVLSLRPHGVIISNGPGNPETAAPVVDTIRDLYGRVPLFGICLGHQLLALAAGGRTYKLKFGHRGANHPVQECDSLKTAGRARRAFITTQNHGYAVDPASLPPELAVSHRNLNDGTVEGLRHRTLPIHSVQFHPEGAPGPTDSSVVLDEWLGCLA